MTQPDAPTTIDLTGDLTLARSAFDAFLTSTPVPADVATSVTQLGGIPVLDVRIEGSAQETVLLYLHGGAYVMGSASASVRLAAAVARAGAARALVVDYRLAPEHPFPAALEDAVATYTALLDSGVRSGRVVVVGESAGGGLALALETSLRDRGLPLPAGTVVFSPWTDLTLSGDSYTERAALDPVLDVEALRVSAGRYAGDFAVSLVSPLFADLQGLPPLLVQVGSAEILLDDATALAARAAAAGVAVTLEVEPGATHVFQNQHDALPAADTALARAGVFLRRITQPDTVPTSVRSEQPTSA